MLQLLRCHLDETIKNRPLPLSSVWSHTVCLSCFGLRKTNEDSLLLILIPFILIIPLIVLQAHSKTD